MEISIYKWKGDQVVEWLKGLESMNSHYIKAFMNNQIDGEKLLNLRPYELEELGIKSVGHQEIILEAVEQLKNIHFNLDKENLQQISMHINSLSYCLYKEISYNPDWTEVNTKILVEVVRIISKIKTLISWLDRNPFNQTHSQYAQYRELRVQLLKFALELATFAHRDRFSQNPIKQISLLTEKLSSLTNYIIRDITDPLLLQPAYLDLVTLKKRESELGFYIMTSYQFIQHRITDIKYNSPAHNSLKVEDGDEIIQVNYQTVIGWQIKKVLLQLEESTTDVLLTLKKRPKHMKIYGYLGMIKLPSKKRATPFRWENLVLPSPRFDSEFKHTNIFPSPVDTIKNKENVSEAGDSSGNESDSITPNENKPSERELRMYLPKPRAETRVLQRRHTISGDDLKSFQNIGNHMYWQHLNVVQETQDSPSLRDKSVSFGYGLDANQRPSTCLGINENIKSNKVKGSLPSMPIDRKNDAIDECDENCEVNVMMGASKVVRFDPTDSVKYENNSKYTCNVEDTIIESLVPFPYVDEDSSIVNDSTVPRDKKSLEPPKPAPRTSLLERNSPNGQQYVEAVNVVILQKEEAKRGRLDKSHSTPTYNDEDLPPAIEPRHQQSRKIPPIPPRKSWNTGIAQISTGINIEENLTKVANIIDLKNFKIAEVSASSVMNEKLNSQFSLAKAQIDNNEIHEPRKKTMCTDMIVETELLTPVKVKTLTNKKKNSLIAKRRKVTLKSLSSSSTIQGNLFKREKDRSEIAYWVKLYCVLVENTLYGFKCKDSLKAEIVIFLSGFTVALADEVHSKKFAFKVYQQKKVFYFAAETQEALSQWIEFLEKASLKSVSSLDSETRDLYSETECSDDETPTKGKHLCTHSSNKTTSELATPTLTKHSLNFGTLKKFTRTSPNNQTTEVSSPLENSKIFRYFSSLNKTSEKKADIIPTNSFKTYKKVKENNGGMQLGSTLMSNVDMSEYLQSGIPINTTRKRYDDDQAAVAKPEKIMDFKQKKNDTDFIINAELVEPVAPAFVKPLKKSLNYLHASNPNLLDFNFNSTSLDFPIQNASTCNWEPTSGMTLLDLMTQQLDEEKRDMYDRRVENGVEKFEDRDRTLIKNYPVKPKIPPKPINTDPMIQKIQKRSLPTRPDDNESFNPEDKDVLFFRSKEGRILREFGYELISSSDDTKDCTFAKKSSDENKIRNDKIFPTNSLRKKSGFNFWDKEETSVSTQMLGTGSFRKSGKNTKRGNNINLQTNDSTAKTTQKNAVPNSSSFPYLSKLNFSPGFKERKIPVLSSPILQRAIFRNSIKKTQQQQSTLLPNNTDSEVFAQITLPMSRLQRKSDFPLISKESSSETPFPSYPELQNTLPPTFKPEIYSLKKTASTKYD